MRPGEGMCPTCGCPRPLQDGVMAPHSIFGISECLGTGNPPEPVTAVITLPSGPELDVFGDPAAADAHLAEVVADTRHLLAGSQQATRERAAGDAA